MPQAKNGALCQMCWPEWGGAAPVENVQAPPTGRQNQNLSVQRCICWQATLMTDMLVFDACCSDSWHSEHLRPTVCWNRLRLRALCLSWAAKEDVSAAYIFGAATRSWGHSKWGTMWMLHSEGTSPEMFWHRRRPRGDPTAVRQWSLLCHLSLSISPSPGVPPTPQKAAFQALHRDTLKICWGFTHPQKYSKLMGTGRWNTSHSCLASWCHHLFYCYNF